MSKEAKPAEGTEQAAPKKSKKLLIIILAAVLVLVLGGGGAAYFLMKKGADEAGDDEDAAETAKPKKKDKKKDLAHPIFVNLDPFTVNLVPETGDQYLQVALSVELDDPQVDASLKAHMPKVRNNVTLLLSGKKASELLSREGKEHLSEELRETINDVLEPPKTNKKGEKVGGETVIKEVLFTSFIIQ